MLSMKWLTIVDDKPKAKTIHIEEDELRGLRLLDRNKFDLDELSYDLAVRLQNKHFISNVRISRLGRALLYHFKKELR